MRSVMVTQFCSNYEDIYIAQTEQPQPGPGQVRVRMLMAAVNPSDMNFVRGDYHQAISRLIWNRDSTVPSFDPAGTQPYPSLPYSLGGEGVGIVDACGSGLMARRLMGKRVAVSAGPPNGTWQDYTVIDAMRAMPVPKNLSNEQAAMYIVNPLSCYAICRHVLKLKKDQWLLISGAGSALSKMAVKLGLQYGFKSICLIRNNSHREDLINIGASAVINTEIDSLIDTVHSLTQGKGVNGAMDCVGGELTTKMLGCLGMNAKLVVYGTLAEPDFTVCSRDLMMPANSITGFYAGSWLAQQSPLTLLSCIRQLGKLTRQGLFHTAVAKTYPLEQAAQALAESFQPGRQGKILLEIAKA